MSRRRRLTAKCNRPVPRYRDRITKPNKAEPSKVAEYSQADEDIQYLPKIDAPGSQEQEHHSTSAVPGQTITSQSPKHSANVTAATSETTERVQTFAGFMGNIGTRMMANIADNWTVPRMICPRLNCDVESSRSDSAETSR